MNAIHLKNLQVGKTYYIHQVKDEDTFEQISRKYKAVCTENYSRQGADFFKIGFKTMKGINTEDKTFGIDISFYEKAWGVYKIYLCQHDEIIERVTVNSALKIITGDPYFKFY